MSPISRASSCGFQPYSYRDFIKQLRQLLQDRYTWDGDAFTILKELIQNANDAGAISLHLGWSPPLFADKTVRTSKSTASPSSTPLTPHPLLTVPALFAVNNGPLRRSDAINITRLGSNSKAGEASSAGRFGLGLKSVFHLCEAFFFLARPFDGDDSLCSLFSPWSPPRGTDEVGPYANWDFDPSDEVSQQVEAAICGRLEPILGKTSPSFCLWIPLRDRRVLKGDPLVNRFLTGEEFGRVLSDRALHLRLAELLPLLHTLAEISVWLPNPSAAIQPQFNVKVNSSSTRPAKLPEPVDERLPSPKQASFSGQVILHSFDKKAETISKFVGAESIIANEAIRTLWNSKNWPPDESLDPVTYEWRSHRVKLIPHGALRFMATPRSTSTGRVSMHWCVFLPLGKNNGDEHLEREALIDTDVSIFLHGYFFIDAGRTRHMKNESGTLDLRQVDAEGLQQSWNAVIERDAVWPQFLEAYAAFVAEMAWDEPQVKELTRAVFDLLKSTGSFFPSGILALVCHSRQWLYLLRSPSDGHSSNGHWTLKTNKVKVHEIPQPNSGVALYELLPGIADAATGQAITFARWPRLSATNPDPWSPSVLAGVVRSLNTDVAFKSSLNLDYIAQLLEHCAANSELDSVTSQRASIGDALWPVLKRAFQDDALSLQRIEELSEGVKRILEFVPEAHRLVLTWASSDRPGADLAFHLIARDKSDLLPIPGGVRPSTGRDCRTLDSRVVVRLLTLMAEYLNDNGLMAEVVGDLLKRADVDRESIWQSLKDVPLFVIYDCLRKQTSRKTWMELQANRRLVFCDRAGLTHQLQVALGTEHQIWRMEPEFADLVLGTKHPFSGCSPTECAAVLASAANGTSTWLRTLGEWNARLDLLARLLPSLGKGMTDEQDRISDACRLLIHGRPQDADFNAVLFLAGDSQSDYLATMLVRHVLAKRGEEWRVLEGEVATWALNEGLTVKQRELLNLSALTLHEPLVLDFLQRAGDEQLRGLVVTADEYVQLIETLDASRDDLLKRLPIHQIANSKKRASIPSEPGNAFWDVGYKLASELTGTIRLLTLDQKNPKVAERQKKLAPVLDRVEAMRLVMKSDHPHEHWQTILRAIEKSDEALPDEVVADLKKKAWLPSRFGEKGRKDLICLTLTGPSKSSQLPEEFRQEVTRLVEANNGAWVADWMLDEKLFKELTRESRATCQRLVEWGVFPSEKESLEQLGCLLGTDQQHAIGFVPFDLFNDWLAIEWDSALMPCHQLLSVMCECFDIEKTFDPGANEVRVPIADLKRLISILNFLGTSHEQAKTRDAKDRILRVFQRYLEFFLLHTDVNKRSQLTSIRLLSQAGKWEPPSQLCFPTDGISPTHILNEAHLELIQIWIKQTNVVSVELLASRGAKASHVQETIVGASSPASVLEYYFRSWESHVPHDVIGGFVALLGGDPDVEDLAKRYLGKRSLDETRRNLCVSPSPFGRRHMRMTDAAFEISIVNSKTELMTNLLGQQFEAALTSSSETILIGRGDGRNYEARPSGAIGLRFRAIDFNETSNPADATRMLSHAATVLLEEVFQIQQHSIRDLVDKTFADLQASDQLEIRVTQQLILEDAELLLAQLGLHSDEFLGAVIATQTRFRRLRAERSHNQERFGRRASWTEDEIDNEQNEANQNLRRLLEDEASGGPARVLNAVRQRIQGHNQYNPAAVPFELFQNADDAAVERTQLLMSSLTADCVTFFVGQDVLAVRHFGRCVNQVPPGCDPRDHKLADDLRKMLTLWLSNKDAISRDGGTVELTGKFGLGFKSVFLVSDKPRLLSGRIACEIVGGVFPRYLDLDERRSFEPLIDDLTDERKRELTVIELPLRNEVVANGICNVFRRFRELAHLLVVFARQVRAIQWNDLETGEKHETSWQDQPIPGIANCFKGCLRPLPLLPIESGQVKPSGNQSFSAQRVLVLRTSKHSGALLLAHDGKQFQRLAEEVPTLWVTAPTREVLDIGFALNAHFSLDPGRAQLGRESPENDDIAADLGRELCQRFSALCDHRSKVTWERFCDGLGWDGRANEYEFWKSLWELIGPGMTPLSETSNAAQLLLRVLWDAEMGALRFYWDRKAIPTCLPGATDERRLVSLRDVRLAIAGVLAEGDGFEVMCVRNWPEFKKRLGKNSLVSDKSVVGPLRKLCPRMADHIKAISLADVLDWEIPNREVAACTASQVGEVIHKDLLDRCDRGERNRLRAICGDARFLNRLGQYVEPERLLIGHRPSGGVNDGSRDDELARAAFAPKGRVLNPNYNPAGLAFFEVCRERLTATAAEMTQWVFDATDDATRQAALWYLAEGDQGRAIQKEINRVGTAGTWLEQLAESEEFQSMEPAQQGRLLEIIPQQQAIDIIEQATTPRLPTPPPPPPDRALEGIWKWWNKEREPHLRKYEQRTFPDGGLRYLNRANCSDDDLFRKDWVTLFLLGLTHTMGRAVAEQHRDFIRRREHDGTLRMIASSEREPSAWMGWIDDFLDRQLVDSKFLQWMKQFVGIYQVSRHLEDYIAAFESVDSEYFKSRSFGLTDITNLRSSSQFSGSNFDAPPLARVLGMGQCFVLRELVRNKVLTNPQAFRHCYVPTQRVRDLLTYELGCEGLGQQSRKWELSEHIYEFLVDHLGNERSWFHYCFDLPFQIIAEDEELQDRFFGKPLRFEDDDTDLWYPDMAADESNA